MACFYDVTREQFKIFGLLALVFSIIYAPLCIVVYFLQLSTVAQNPLHFSSEVMKTIVFKPGSPMFAIDILGYCFLCFSTLSAGFALEEAKVLKVLCFLHGAIAVSTFTFPILSELFLTESGEIDFTGHYVLLGWCTLFVPIALLFMRYFRERQVLNKSHTE